MSETHSTTSCSESTSTSEKRCSHFNEITVNPYVGIKDHCYGSRGVMRVAPGLLDPITTSMVIDKKARISTIGSCFAQHVSRHLIDAGCNFFVAEKPPSEYNAEKKKRYNYEIYSARYGNVYTARQALQLFDRAYDYFKPRDGVWNKADKYVDAFRPTIDPVGWTSVEEVRNETRQHLKFVRDVFEQSDWIFFTLGLTEAWLSTTDGAVYPIAPGVAGGSFDPQRYVFHNFSYSEVVADLSLFIDKLLLINPTIKIILTVSPVPLIATYENRHVLVSTIHSKSVLCAAAHEIENRYKNVIYFPAYDIITSPLVQGKYFNNDLRTVNSVGVGHVMRLFKEHFLEQSCTFKDDQSIHSNLISDDIVCDEECIERIFIENNTNSAELTSPYIDITNREQTEDQLESERRLWKEANDQLSSIIRERDLAEINRKQAEDQLKSERRFRKEAEEQLGSIIKERDLAEINRKQAEDQLKSERRFRKEAEEQLSSIIRERDLAEINRKQAEDRLESERRFRKEAEDTLKDAIKNNDIITSCIGWVGAELHEMQNAIFFLAHQVPYDMLCTINFNELFYFENNKDVKDAFAQGKIKSGISHWLTYGYFENRKVSFVQNSELWPSVLVEGVVQRLRPLKDFQGRG